MAWNPQASPQFFTRDLEKRDSDLRRFRAMQREKR